MDYVGIWPGIAAAVCAMLAGVVLVPSRRTPRYVFFALMNLGMFMWSLAYFAGFVAKALVPARDLSAVGEIMFVTGAAGGAIVATYWFLLAVEMVGDRRWTHGWRLALVHVPGALLVVLALTNQFHHLVIAPADWTRVSEFTYAPLGLVLVAVCWLLVFVATILYVLAAVGSKGRTTAAAWTLVVAGVVPLAGNVVWITRTLNGISLPYNPTIVLLVFSSVAIAVTVFRGGLMDVLPLAESEAFHSMSDAAIVMGTDWRIVALNPAAERILPSVAVGRTLGDVVEALGADPALPGLEEPGARPELELGGSHYWVRLEPMRGPDGKLAGELLLLTDITEKREYEKRILDLNAELQKALPGK